MRMVPAAFGALTIVRTITLSRRGAILGVPGVRMVRAATHHQVDYQRRGDQDAAQPGHKDPCLPHIRYRQRNLTILNSAHNPQI